MIKLIQLRHFVFYSVIINSLPYLTQNIYLTFEFITVEKIVVFLFEKLILWWNGLRIFMKDSSRYIVFYITFFLSQWLIVSSFCLIQLMFKCMISKLRFKYFDADPTFIPLKYVETCKKMKYSILMLCHINCYVCNLSVYVYTKDFVWCKWKEYIFF